MKPRKHRAVCFLAAGLVCPTLAPAEPVYRGSFLLSTADIDNAGRIAGNTRSQAWIRSDAGIVNPSRRRQ